MSSNHSAALPTSTGDRTGNVILVCAAVWMVAVLVLGVRLALDFAGGPWQSWTGPSMFVAAAVVYAACLVSTIVAWRLRPTSTLVVAAGTAGIIVGMAAIATGTLVTLAIVLGIAAVTLLAGHAIVGGLIASQGPYLGRIVIAFALGNGLLGLLFLLLGSLDRLDAGSVVIALAVIAALSVMAIVRRGESVRSIGWKPSPTSWWEAVFVGSASGLMAFALLTALLPEWMSDAVREHLPLARQIWETGSTSGLIWTTANLPIHPQLVSVLGWAVGGDVGVKLSHALVGLATVAGVGSLAWLLAGRAAAVIAATIFATIPIVLWEVGHAYVDLYPTLFCTASAIAILLWQESGRRAALLLGGALAGFAFASKVVSSSAIVGLAFAVAIVGRGRRRFRERAEALLVYALGGLVALPWVYWSYQKTGSIPGLDYALNALVNPASDIVGNLDDFGIGRDLLSILAIPWAATFGGERFSEAGAGNLGILPLMTLPAILFAPRTRGTAFVAVAALVAYLGWAFSAQYFRYGLPVFALTCALLGVGLAGLVSRLSMRGGGRSVQLLYALLVVGLAVTPLLFLMNWLFRMPPQYFAGGMDRDGYLAQTVLGYRALDRSSVLVGKGNTVGWVGFIGAPDIFTEAALLELTPPAPGTPSGDVLSDLRARGVSHFVWERIASDLSAWRSPMLSSQFLRDHTRVLYGADNAYLFELFDEPRDRWGSEADNIVSPTPGRDPEASRWALVGNVTTSDGETVVRSGTAIHHEVPVQGGSPYLLVADAHCAGADDRLILAMSWSGADGPVSLDWQLVVPGEQSSEQFLWAVSPEKATNAVVQVSAWGDGMCMVDGVSLIQSEPRGG